MTVLLNGHTVLKSSPAILVNGTIYRYRMTLDTNNRYVVHVESRESFGALNEQYLYQGDSITTANHVFDRYSQEG